MSLGYAYGTSNNPPRRGNVQSQTITAPGLSLTQTYGYDWLNRLTGMNETSGWSETFSYDPYGNRTGGSSSSPYMPLQIPTINAQTNKISAANHSYDPVGNLTQGLGADGLVKTYTYDAENRLATFNGSAASYSYDGDGRRVKKVVGSATTVLVYDAHGQMVAEYSNQAPTTSGGTTYVTADHLGSTRLVTDSTGTVIARHDFAPFGEEITSVIGGRSGVTGYGVDEGLRQKFTGKERDVESGLDYFGARYFSAAQGRFTSPDPTFMTKQRIGDPQQWNLYAYTRNNPLKYVDPDGQELKLAIYNSSSLPRSAAARVADRIANILRGAGLKNVTYEVHQGRPGAATVGIYELTPTPHSHLLEIRPSRAGSPEIRTTEGGHNWDFGGHSAIDVSAVSGKVSTPTELETGLSNMGTHEILHDRLGHVDDDPSNIMNGNGAESSNWLKNPNLTITPGQAKVLQDQYNRPGEVDVTPPPPPPPPKPPKDWEKLQ